MRSTKRTERACLHALAIVVMFVAPHIHAASILDFDIWMRRIDKRSQAMQRQIKAQDAAAASGEARQLQELYRLMEDYFLKTGSAPDAVSWSREGKELAASIELSVQQSDFDAALKSAVRIAQECNTCHDAYKPFK